jgi:hypothetical protein
MKKYIALFTIFFALVFSGCGGSSSSTNDGNTSATTSNTISGTVNDDPVAGAKVYVDFDDGNHSTVATTNADGSFKIKLSNEDLAVINPEVPEGADAPIDDLMIVAQKNGKVLRNAIDRDVANGKSIYITNDTEAYAEYLESIGKFDPNLLANFNNELEKGRIKDSSKYAKLIKDLRKDVKSYFYGGDKPTKKAIFEKALQDLNKSQIAQNADDRSMLLSRNIVSGGDIILPDDVNVSSDDITITPKGNGRYTLGDGNNPDKTVYLKISKSDGTFALLPINIKSKTVTEIANRSVTPQEEATLGNGNDVKVIIPPFALNETKNITIKKIETKGESVDGKKILDLEPHGTQFQVPITIKINYADFGITDPYAVQWKYGSLDEGYDNADIVNIDTANKVIYLNVDHFSDLVIKKINGKEFLDLGPNYMIIIPRRDTRYNVFYDERAVKDASKIITNKLFPGSSVSNRIAYYNNIGHYNVGGGQCVQFAQNFYYPLKFNKRPVVHGYSTIQANIIFEKLDPTREGFRNSADECQEGDIVAVSSLSGTGHIGIFKSKEDKTPKENNISKKKYTLTLIQSNSVNPDINTMIGGLNIYGNPATRGQYWEERFSIGPAKSISEQLKYRTNRMNRYSVTNEFVCLGKEYFDDNRNIDDINNFKIVFSVDNNGNGSTNSTYNNIGNYKNFIEKPYLYYFITPDDYIGIYKNNGITKVGNQYKYDPDLLPVAPLRVKFDNGVGKIQNAEDAKYEIYAENVNGATFKTGSGLNLDYSDTNITLPNEFGNNIKLTRLTVKLKDRNQTNLTMIGDNYSRTIKVSGVNSPIKMLFSPIVIDDYYVNWGKNNNNNHDIPIGFWNTKGYNLTYADKYIPLPISSATLPTIEADKIYKTENAVNGYFMTLGNGESAEWHFALAGPHAIYINVPTGNMNDIKYAKYALYRDGKKLTDLKPIDLLANNLEHLTNSAFKTWIALQSLDGNVSFNFTGNEYVKVTAEGGPVAVDAIRLEGRKDRIEKLIAFKTLVDVARSSDRKLLICKLIIKNLDNGKKISKFIPFGKSLEIKLHKPLKKTAHLKFTYFAFINSMVNKSSTISKSSLKRSVESDVGNLATKYKPVIQNITIRPDETVKNIPAVTLQPYGTKDSVKLHLINAVDGSAIKDANVTIRYGIDNDNNQSVAYSGITDENGYFAITNMPYGQYTALFRKNGFISTNLNMKVDENSNSSYDLSMSPALAQGEMRIRLSWGANPSDLDSHLVKYVNGNQEYHIYYSDPTGTNGDNLDRDDTDGYGPETVTIKEVNASDKYVYFVHKYAGEGDIKNSGASVKISYGNSEQTFYPPQKDGIYWKVFTIENGTITPCTSNCMANDASTIDRSINKTNSSEFDIFKNLPAK